MHGLALGAKEVPIPLKSQEPTPSENWDGSISTITMLLEKLKVKSPDDFLQHQAILTNAMANMHIPHDLHEIIVRSVYRVILNSITTAEVRAASVLDDCINRFSARESALQDDKIESIKESVDKETSLKLDSTVY